MTEEKTLKRDKLLLDLMIHVYDEEVQRNELIDSKNSQMIVLSGAMLTLQATLFSNLLISQLSNINISQDWKTLLIILMLSSIILVSIAMCTFIKAYVFKNTFKEAPSPKFLSKQYGNNIVEEDILDKILTKLPKTIMHNYNLMKGKVGTAKYGFIFLIWGVISMVASVILLFITVLL